MSGSLASLCLRFCWASHDSGNLLEELFLVHAQHIAAVTHDLQKVYKVEFASLHESSFTFFPPAADANLQGQWMPSKAETQPIAAATSANAWKSICS
jgi:hypothetical protein